MSVKTGIDSIVRANRQRAVTKNVVKGGEEGKALAKAARLSTDVMPGIVMVDGEQKKVWIMGLHPMTDDYVVL